MKANCYPLGLRLFKFVSPIKYNCNCTSIVPRDISGAHTHRNNKNRAQMSTRIVKQNKYFNINMFNVLQGELFL